jgi:hypothetical protein
MPTIKTVALSVLFVVALGISVLLLAPSSHKPLDNLQVAEIDIDHIGIGLELFFQENGTYPESLSALVPIYLNSSPKPPWGGEYGYTRSDNKVSVYTVIPGKQELPDRRLEKVFGKSN